MYQYKALLSQLDKDNEPGFGIRRSLVIDRFNAIALDHYPPDANLEDPLTSIMYVPPKVQTNRFYRDIAYSMIDLPWVEKYGLTYKDLVEMPFSEYNTLKDILIESRQQQSSDVLYQQAVLKRLSDIVVAILRGTLSEGRPLPPPA